jgi:uroporphyrinogen III methyltransferase / synthase
MQDDASSAGRYGPLAGLCVMVTRPEVEESLFGGADSPHPDPLPAGEGTMRASADPLAERLRDLGAEVIVQPAIRISPPADWRPVDDALGRLDEYDWLVFSSANGVRAVVERWRAATKGTGTFCAQHPEGGHHPKDGRGKRCLSPFPLRIAAMGPGTADELARAGLRADLVPQQFRAESLAEALVNAEKGTVPVCAQHPEGRSGKRCLSPFPLTGKRFLLARASRGRDVLAERLTAAGAAVDQIVVYASNDVEQPDAQIAVMLRAGRVDWITVTSSAIARSLVRLFGDDLRHAKLASISPITSGVLRELGCQPAAEATEYTLVGLAGAVVEAR